MCGCHTYEDFSKKKRVYVKWFGDYKKYPTITVQVPLIVNK